MPRLDGTGPKGLGPMTGRGSGFCVVKLPNGPEEPITGLAGRACQPVGRTPGEDAELVHLRRQAWQIETVLGVIRRRIERLQAGRRREALGV